MERKTPLYERHVAAGGKIVPFAGYLMPVQYPTGVIGEHMAVRTKCGLFDVSHMGEVLIEGADALSTMQHLFTNDFTSMVDGQVRYSPMLSDDGGILDDLIVYRVHPEKYLIVVNASGRERDVQWMRAHLTGDAKLTDISDDVCELALQGPEAKAILSKLADPATFPQKYYYFVWETTVAGVPVLLSRTGYTGEFGYELYAKAEYAEHLWDALLEAGAEFGLIPCGLGARDTLRLEAGMPLYGHEMDETIMPTETGLSWAVKLDTHDFIGRDALIAKPATRARVGLKVTGKGIVREHQSVSAADGQVTGMTTSGTFLPYLNGAYAMALVGLDCASEGTELSVDVRGRKVPCVVVKLPFYKRAK